MSYLKEDFEIQLNRRLPWDSVSSKENTLHHVDFPGHSFILVQSYKCSSGLLMSSESQETHFNWHESSGLLQWIAFYSYFFSYLL